ncbi:MAG: 6-bladed beta-propeller [Acidobacteriota bacterium]|nr:6-bladed beta-propeller [Acidobacteriota bacterium]
MLLSTGLIFSLFFVNSDNLLDLYRNGQGDFTVRQTYGLEGAGQVLEPVAVKVDAEGRVLVLDIAEHNVKVFDMAGNHLMNVGKAGQGPGEFAMATGLAVGPDGSIVIYDMIKRRFGIFDNQGHFQKFLTYPKTVWAFRLAPGGVWYLETRDLDMSGKKGGSLTNVVRWVPGESSETVIDSERIKDVTLISKPVKTSIPRPFHKRFLWDCLSDGRLVVVRSEPFQVSIYGTDGKLLQQRTQRGKSAPVTEADRETFYAGISVTNNDGTLSQGAPAYVRAAVVWPEFKPPCQNLYIDQDDRILIQTHVKQDTRFLYYVLGTDAKRLYEVRLPALDHPCFRPDGIFHIQSAGEDESAAAVRLSPGTRS